jgi:hypothetical protein
MSENGHKRRQILVDKRLQLGLTLNVLGWLAFYVVLFTCAVNSSALWTLVTAAHNDPAYAQASERLQWFLRSTILPLSVMFVGVAAHGVVFAHRIAGPIRRIETVLRDLASRKYPTTPVTLRPNDYLKNVASRLTCAIDTLRDDAARMRRMNQETLRSVRQLLDVVETGRADTRTLTSIARAALERAEQFDRHLAVGAPEGAEPNSPAQREKTSALVGAAPAA